MTGHEKTGWVIWFVGLPGSGKSTCARAVYRSLLERGIDSVYLSMDERRRTYFPEPKYTDHERELAYRMFAEEAASLAWQGTNVIMDGTGHQLSMRQYARQLIPRFAEIYIRCPLDVAIAREEQRPDGQVMAGLYRKARERQEKGTTFAGLGKLVGVDIPFEENPDAECVIESDQASIEAGRERVIDFLEGWI